MNGWSDTSIVEFMSLADSASVRAMRSMGFRRMSSWKREAMRRDMWVDVGTRTLPARWPHCSSVSL